MTEPFGQRQLDGAAMRAATGAAQAFADRRDRVVGAEGGGHGKTELQKWSHFWSHTVPNPSILVDMLPREEGPKTVLICDFLAPSISTNMALGGFESRRGHHSFPVK